METVVGIFSTQSEARRAARSLMASGIPAERVNLLTPGEWKAEVQEVPLSDTEQSGTAKAIGGVVGGAAGASAGYALGPLVAGLFLPGVGAVSALGLAGAALLGAGGVVGGAAGGQALERSLSDGLPHDEIFLYEDALRRGRSVVVAMIGDHEKAENARGILAESGAESIDSAREAWWVGLRDVARSEFQGDDGEFPFFERMYRLGYEAAQRPEFRGRRFDEVENRLRQRYLDAWENEAFRRGFERAQQMRAERETVNSPSTR